MEKELIYYYLLNMKSRWLGIKTEAVLDMMAKTVNSLASQNGLYKYNMPQRKIWTEEEDKILKFLKQERGERKWANIARIMECEFGIKGRTGKQCRDRYHNHLDSAIVNTEWTAEQEKILYDMHEEIGNKWSAISQRLPGRSDNCVKNHFYSKLRKSIRKLNKIIAEYFDKDNQEIRERILSKIIEIQETKFQVSSKVEEELADFCRGIKNRLFIFEGKDQQIDDDVLQEARKLIVDIGMFENNYKKGYKAIKKSQHELKCKGYLKLPTIKRSNSVSSDKSDDSSFLSSNSYFSSCSDLSEDQIPFEDNKRSNTGSFGHSSGEHSDILKNEKPEQVENINQSQFYFSKVEEDALQMEVEQRQQEIVQVQSPKPGQYQKFFSIFDDTLFMARVISPSGIVGDSMSESQFRLFQDARDNDEQYFAVFRLQKDEYG